MTIYCSKLQTLPRGLGKLGALKLTLAGGLHELQEMPDLIDLTALDSLTIQYCYKLKMLPRGLGKLWAFKQLTLRGLNELQHPAVAADWTNAMALDYLRVQQQKVAACASGMHAQLGAASGVLWLGDQTLVMIVDEFLGGWGLLKEWRQELVAADV